MKANVSNYEMKAPENLLEALKILKSEGAQWRPVAGGTDLMVLFEAGKLPEGKYLSLHRLSSLKGIVVSDRTVVIKALATFGDIRAHEILKKEFPMLVKAACLTGAIAIQNRGTLGGNIANASPAADSPPALLCYDAELELVSVQGTRLIPYHQFHQGYKKMDLKKGELIQAIHLPRQKSKAVDYYHKVGTREAQSISKVCFASRIWKQENKIQDIRLALGSVAAMPMRAINTEESLRGKILSKATIDKALKVLEKDITPMDDIRSTAEYRLTVAKNLLRHTLGT